MASNQEITHNIEENREKLSIVLKKTETISFFYLFIHYFFKIPKLELTCNKLREFSVAEERRAYTVV